MSNLLFPDLHGLAWSYTLTPMFSTEVQQATSGREVRAAFWSAPLWKMALTYEFLHDDAQHVDSNGYTELQQLVGFFLARQGQFDSFFARFGAAYAQAARFNDYRPGYRHWRWRHCELSALA